MKTPLIYTEGKKRKNLTNKMQFFGFLRSWSFVGSGLRPSVGVSCFHPMEEAAVGRVTR